jgi:ABC-2 type transport system ATP-binding protein
MGQRLGVARCLLCDPGLLVLDEPVNGLVRSLVDERRTVWLSSHLPDEGLLGLRARARGPLHARLIL